MAKRYVAVWTSLVPAGCICWRRICPEQGLVLFQMDVERKENEIPVAKRLLKHLDLRGKVVTGDALLTQRKLCLQIVAAGGELCVQSERQSAAIA